MMTRNKPTPSLLHRIFSITTLFHFVFYLISPSLGYSQGISTPALNLPAPGTMVTTSPVFFPMMIKGVNVNSDDPLKFDFIMDQGNTNFDPKTFNEESTKLIKYFLAALTVPEQEMWVNLSPYEKDRIIPSHFGRTQMGRDLLAQDYLLKQLSSSLMYPKGTLGKDFWERVYAKAQDQFQTSEIPMDTFNKIWIVPEEAFIYEHTQGAFIVNTHLKVLLDEDYLALDANQNSTQHGLGNVQPDDLQSVRGISNEVMRQVIIPAIEQEVNQGKTFAPLRQIYHSVILASWYKQALKESLLGKVYVDQNKTEGMQNEDVSINQKIYDQYIEAFQRGVYDLIQEEYDPHSRSMISRKYFSGGVITDARDLVGKRAGKGTFNPARAADNNPKIDQALATTLSPQIRQQILDSAAQIQNGQIVTAGLQTMDNEKKGILLDPQVIIESFDSENNFKEDTAMTTLLQEYPNVYPVIQHVQQNNFLDISAKNLQSVDHAMPTDDDVKKYGFPDMAHFPKIAQDPNYGNQWTLSFFNSTNQLITMLLSGEIYIDGKLLPLSRDKDTPSYADWETRIDVDKMISRIKQVNELTDQERNTIIKFAQMAHNKFRLAPLHGFTQLNQLPQRLMDQDVTVSLPSGITANVEPLTIKINQGVMVPLQLPGNYTRGTILTLDGDILFISHQNPQDPTTPLQAQFIKEVPEPLRKPLAVYLRKGGRVDPMIEEARQLILSKWKEHFPEWNPKTFAENPVGEYAHVQTAWYGLDNLFTQLHNQFSLPGQPNIRIETIVQTANEFNEDTGEGQIVGSTTTKDITTVGGVKQYLTQNLRAQLSGYLKNPSFNPSSTFQIFYENFNFLHLITIKFVVIAPGETLSRIENNFDQAMISMQPPTIEILDIEQLSQNPEDIQKLKKEGMQSFIVKLQPYDKTDHAMASKPTITTYEVQDETTRLLDIAERYGMSPDQILHLNPGIDLHQHIPARTKVNLMFGPELEVITSLDDLTKDQINDIKRVVAEGIVVGVSFFTHSSTMKDGEYWGVLGEGVEGMYIWSKIADTVDPHYLGQKARVIIQNRRLSQVYNSDGDQIFPQSAIPEKSENQTPKALDQATDPNLTHGGIDMNPSIGAMNIHSDGQGVVLPISGQTLEEMNVQGFIPVILNIVPLNNLPFILGLSLTTEGKSTEG